MRATSRSRAVAVRPLDLLGVVPDTGPALFHSGAAPPPYPLLAPLQRGDQIRVRGTAQAGTTSISCELCQRKHQVNVEVESNICCLFQREPVRAVRPSTDPYRLGAHHRQMLKFVGEDRILFGSEAVY